MSFAFVIQKYAVWLFHYIHWHVSVYEEADMEEGSWKRWRLALSNIIILLYRLLLQIAEVKQEAVSTECQSGFTLHTDIHPMSLP